uniref:Uncharacterized protein n=1 Tax=Chromera velia CCMP2878 TaxID=1169474 RepID=A0A0G4I0P4_9ALVE|eukprot:Cvel_9999.t1-p1 / transcript=Cvel_9999.t1 / gene=Cvel_9999 / organism=Chromera_velia_CCMP2878 / gene_product=hypothetical protein / transcript_product=hypothetical protein / location=Cvel_scaffold592:39896-41911(-) / protein_length=304 / sequence_SO=supercontig / SO=protein_coding / is_pseudo=false
MKLISFLLSTCVCALHIAQSSARLGISSPLSSEPCVRPQASELVVGPLNESYAFPSSGDATFQQIAEAWIQAGGESQYCAAALVIASGECRPFVSGGLVVGCDITATGASGIWQLTGLVNRPCDLQNIGCSVQQLYNFIIQPDINPTTNQTNYNTGCFTQGGLEETTELVPDGFRSAGNCNWVGPFCHIGIVRSGATAGYIWGGGQEMAQPPFPTYYYDKFPGGLSSAQDICDNVGVGGEEEADGEEAGQQGKKNRAAKIELSELEKAFKKFGDIGDFGKGLGGADHLKVEGLFSDLFQQKDGK